jgi:hypothetical protein
VIGEFYEGVFDGFVEGGLDGGGLYDDEVVYLDVGPTLV